MLVTGAAGEHVTVKNKVMRYTINRVGDALIGHIILAEKWRDNNGMISGKDVSTSP